MIKRIDLFMPPNVSQYGVLNFFTQRLHEAFQRLGVTCRILQAEHNNPKPFLTELFKDLPDCTLSFNGLLPDAEGRFFADLIKIPHVAFVVDSPNGYYSLAKSPYTIIATVDRQATEFYKGLNGRPALFIPHGVEKNVPHPNHDEPRPYDVVMLGSCIDEELIRADWKKKYSPGLVKSLEEAAEQALSDDKISYVQAFVSAINKHVQSGELDPAKVDMLQSLDELEMYTRGKERLELVRAIKDARIDIFGASEPTTSWKKQLQGQSNIVIHDPVPYDQALEIMSRSKIVLSSCAWIKYGTHERTLAGMSREALVLTRENEYMREHFQDGTHLAYYNYKNIKKANETVNKYLSNEDLRRTIAHAGREQVLHHHTWDQRAATLLKELTPLLTELRERK